MAVFAPPCWRAARAAARFSHRQTTAGDSGECKHVFQGCRLNEFCDADTQTFDLVKHARPLTLVADRGGGSTVHGTLVLDVVPSRQRH